MKSSYRASYAAASLVWLLFNLMAIPLATASPYIHETLSFHTHSSMNFEETESYCNGFGEVLAHISNKDQWINLSTKLNGGGNFPSSGDGCWLGGTDEDVEGTWRWYRGRLSGEMFFKESGSQWVNNYYGQFESGEPNNNAFGQDYLRVFGSNPKRLYDYQSTLFRPDCSICVKEWCNGDDDCYGHGHPTTAGRTFMQGCGSCTCDLYYSGGDCSVYDNPLTGTKIQRYTVGFGKVTYKTYTQAQAHCSGLGGFLAQPGDVHEVEALGTSRGDPCWIGGSYITDSSTYVYDSSAGRNGGKTIRTGSTNTPAYSSLPFASTLPTATTAPLISYADTTVSYSDKLVIASSKTSLWSYTSLRCWYCMWQTCANHGDCHGNAASVTGTVPNCVCICNTGYLQHRKCATETVSLSLSTSGSSYVTITTPITDSILVTATATGRQSVTWTASGLTDSRPESDTASFPTLSATATQTHSQSTSFRSASVTKLSASLSRTALSASLSSTRSATNSLTATLSRLSLSESLTRTSTESLTDTDSRLSVSETFSSTVSSSSSASESSSLTQTITASQSDSATEEITRTMQCVLTNVLSHEPLFQTLPLGPSILVAGADGSAAYRGTLPPTAAGCSSTELFESAEERYLHHVLHATRSESVQSVLSRLPTWVAPAQAAVFATTRAERNQLNSKSFALTQADVVRFAGLLVGGSSDGNSHSDSANASLASSLRTRGTTVGMHLSTRYIKGLVGQPSELPSSPPDVASSVQGTILGTLFSVGDAQRGGYPTSDAHFTTTSAANSKSDLLDFYRLYRSRAQAPITLRGLEVGSFDVSARTQVLSHVEVVNTSHGLEASLSSFPSWGAEVKPPTECLPTATPPPSQPQYLRSRALLLLPSFVTSKSGGRPRGLSSLIPKISLPPQATLAQKRLMANTVAVVVIEVVTPLLNTTSVSPTSLDLCSRDPTCACVRGYVLRKSDAPISLLDEDLDPTNMRFELERALGPDGVIPCGSPSPLRVSDVTTDHTALAANTIIASSAFRVSLRVWWPYSEPVDPICATLVDILGLTNVDDRRASPFGVLRSRCSAPRDASATRGYQSYLIEEDESVATRLFLDTLAPALPIGNTSSSSALSSPQTGASAANNDANISHPCVIDPVTSIVDLPLLTIAAPAAAKAAGDDVIQNVQGSATVAVALSGLSGGNIASDLQSVLALKMIPCGQPRQQQARDPNTGRLIPSSGYRGLSPIALSRGGFGLAQTVDALRVSSIDDVSFPISVTYAERNLSTGGVWAVMTRGLFPSGLASTLASLGIAGTPSDAFANMPSASAGHVVATSSTSGDAIDLNSSPDSSSRGSFYTHGGAGVLLPNAALLATILLFLCFNVVRVRRRVHLHVSFRREQGDATQPGPYPELDQYDRRIQTRWDTTCTLAMAPTLLLTAAMALLPGSSMAATLLYLDRMSVLSMNEILHREGYPGDWAVTLQGREEGASNSSWSPLADAPFLFSDATAGAHGPNGSSCFALEAWGTRNDSTNTTAMSFVNATQFYCAFLNASLEEGSAMMASRAGPSIMEVSSIPSTQLVAPLTMNTPTISLASRFRVWNAAQLQLHASSVMPGLVSSQGSASATDPGVSFVQPFLSEGVAISGAAQTASSDPTFASAFSTEDIERLRAAHDAASVGWLCLCAVTWSLMGVFLVGSQVGVAFLTTRSFHRLVYDRWVVGGLTAANYTDVGTSYLHAHGFTSRSVHDLVSLNRRQAPSLASLDASFADLEMNLLPDGKLVAVTAQHNKLRPHAMWRDTARGYIRYALIAMFFPVGQLDLIGAPSSKMFSKFVSKQRLRHPLWSLLQFTFLVSIVPLTVSSIAMQRRLGEYDSMPISAKGLYAGDSGTREQIHPFTPPTDFVASETTNCVVTYAFTAAVQMLSVLVLIAFRPNVTLFVNLVDAAKLFINALLYLNAAVSLADSTALQRESEERGARLSDLATSSAQMSASSWRAVMSSQYGSLHAPPQLPGFLSDQQIAHLSNLLIALTVIHLLHLLIHKGALFLSAMPVPVRLRGWLTGYDWYDFFTTRQRCTTAPDPLSPDMERGVISRCLSGGDESIKIVLSSTQSSSNEVDEAADVGPRKQYVLVPSRRLSHYSSVATSPLHSLVATPVRQGGDLSLDAFPEITASKSTNSASISPNLHGRRRASSTGTQVNEHWARTGSVGAFSSGMQTPLESLPITPTTSGVPCGGGGRVISIPFPSPPKQPPPPPRAIGHEDMPPNANIDDVGKGRNEEFNTTPHRERYLLPPVLPTPDNEPQWDWVSQLFPFPENVVQLLTNLGEGLPRPSSNACCTPPTLPLPSAGASCSSDVSDTETVVGGGVTSQWANALSEKDLDALTNRANASQLERVDEALSALLGRDIKEIIRSPSASSEDSTPNDPHAASAFSQRILEYKQIQTELGQSSKGRRSGGPSATTATARPTPRNESTSAPHRPRSDGRRRRQANAFNDGDWL